MTAETVFVLHSRTWQYIHMPFSLGNALTFFDRAVGVLFTKSNRKTCSVYLDVKIINSNTIEDHIERVDDLLGILKHGSIAPKMKNCNCFTAEVKYLGHLIKPGKFEIDLFHTASVKEALPKRTKLELRVILRLRNVYRRIFDDSAK